MSAKREASEIFAVNRSPLRWSVEAMITPKENTFGNRSAKSRRVMRWAAAVTLGATALLSSGCLLLAAGAAGAGTVAYVRGELAASLGSELSAVVKATSRSIEQLKFAKISESADALSARFTARTAQDKKIEIVLTKIGENLTKVEIRVGVFGDEDISMTILSKIKATL